MRGSGRFIVVALLSVAAGCASNKTVAPSGPISAPPTTVPTRVTLDLPDLGSTLGTETATSTPLTPDSRPLGTSSSSTDTSLPETTGTWVTATEGLVGLPSECGNMALVSARPDNAGLIASVALQGLWANDPAADTWVRLGTGKGSAVITNRATSVVYDPLQPSTFWESGIYHDGGVYRTDDGGQTFRVLGNIVHAEAVSVDFTDAARSTLLATEHEDSSVSRSTDGGQTWTDVSAGLPAGTGYSTGPVVIDATTFLLGTSHGTASGVFRSTDGGITWTRVFESGVTALPLVTSDGTFYWVAESRGAVIRSVDQGVTWTVVSKDGSSAPQGTSLVQLPGGALAALGGTTIITSTDDGATWNAIGAPLPFTPSGMIYSAWRHAFYVWRFDCDFSTADPIQADSIMRMDYATTAG